MVDIHGVVGRLVEAVEDADTAAGLGGGGENSQGKRLFVNDLNEDERHAFLGRYWYLLPIGQISERLGWSESKTKSLLHRLRKRLKRRLEEEGFL